MKIRFQNGAIQTTRGDIGVLFVAAGLAQEVFDVVAPAVKLPTNWTVGIVAATGTPYIEARCPNQPCASQRLKHIAQGPNAPEQPFQHCGHRGGELCPPEIEEQFKRLMKKAKPARPEKVFDDAL